MFPFAIGSIYTLHYRHWKENPKIYALILYSNPANPKVHLLNLGAKQLAPYDRIKIVRTLARLSKIPQSSKYNGRMLYRIFKTYLYKEVRKCYRTFWRQHILRASLISYGLNEEKDLKEFELAVENQQLHIKANNDLFVKSMHQTLQRKHNLAALRKQLAETAEKEAKEAEAKAADSTTSDASKGPTGYF